MKKSIVFALVFAIVLSLTACGSNTSSGSNSVASPSAAAADSSSAASTMPKPADSVTMQTVKGITGDIVRYTTAAPSKMTKADPTTLYVGQQTNIQSGNPASGGDSPFYDLVFDPLISIDFNTGAYVGKVIKEWKLADDCSSITFSIHDNITFQDGTKATMKDVFYTLQRFNDVKLANTADKNVFGNIDFDKSQIIDDYNAKIVFKTPTNTIIAGLAKCWLLSKDYITTKGEDNAWWNNCIGTGQYKVESVVQGDRYNLVRNDNYWGETKGAFNKIVIRYYAEMSTMYMDFETGSLDIAINPFSTDVQRIINGEVQNTVCDIYPMLITYNLAFNEEKNPVLNNENLRKAISLALDPATIAAAGYDFLALPSNSIFPRGIKDAYTYDHVQDIDAAKQALADAGYKPGELTLVWGTNNMNVNTAMAETVQAELAEIGINVEMKTVDPQAHILNFMNRGSDVYDMSISMTSIGNLEPTLLLGIVSIACGAPSFAAVTDPQVDQLSLAAKNALNDKDEQDAMVALQKYLVDHYWTIPVADTKAAVIYRDYLTGIKVIQPRSANLTGVTLIG